MKLYAIQKQCIGNLACFDTIATFEKTKDGLENAYKELDRLNKINPIYKLVIINV